MEKVHSPQEVAATLGVSLATVYRLIKQGKVKAAEIGGQYRIPESEYERLIGTNTDAEG